MTTATATASASASASATLARFAYDEVPYDTEANVEAHPVAMATLARLHGLSPVPAANARVLEIGCGDGGNMAAAAAYLPNATFVGFDLAKAAIAAGKAVAPANVALFVGDIVSVAGDPRLGSFDYVIAHGICSWVPAPVREALLTSMRAALAPAGIGFLSFNAMPGWKYRASLRELMRDGTRSIADAGERTRAALGVVAEIARGGKDAPGYLGELAGHAAGYLDHVRAATPPDAAFSHYVFHDLLAETNDAFAYPEMESLLAAAGLRVITETPLLTRPRDEMPFLQLLIQRDDAPAALPMAAERAGELFLWCDFAPAGQGAWRTTTGAVVRPPPGSGLERAARLAPGFARVRDLDPDPRFAAQLLEGFREGVFVLRSEPPRLTPEVPAYVRSRADRALAASKPSEVLTSALHRSYRVNASDLTLDPPQMRDRLERLAFASPSPALARGPSLARSPAPSPAPSPAKADE